MDHDQDYVVGTPVIFTQDIFTEPYPGNLIAKKGWKGIIKYKAKNFPGNYEIGHIDKSPNTMIICTPDQFKPLINEKFTSKEFMNKETLLHYLRLPYNVNVDEMCKARYQAADELERLYKLEKSVKKLILKLEKHETSCVHE
jgi:hypothetical protein